MASSKPDGWEDLARVRSDRRYKTACRTPWLVRCLPTACEPAEWLSVQIEQVEERGAGLGA
ncbi:hypothetical protein [Streptomyces sp. NPDC057580]|uniref:hypothetical protein n=1 Tax=Streptomyces sp. NPDC057580 TaxID=3346173 RepID=UPI0036BA56A6